MHLACENQIALRAGAYQARIAPAAGGRVASLEWRGAGAPRSLLVPWDGAPFDEHGWPKAGAFPMLPFANRLPAGGFHAGGRLVWPEPGPNGFAVHGVAHRRSWELVAAASDRARMRLAQPRADAGWPWRWSAEQDVRLDADGLSVVIRVRNEDSEPMPLGMGWHPYHPVGPDLGSVHIRFQAGARRDLDCQGRAVNEDTPPVFGKLRGETAAFTRWDGRLRLNDEGRGGGSIAISCNGASTLVLHRPAAGDYLCVEPVTGLPGRLGKDADRRGFGWLQPGQTRRLSWTCAFKAAT